MASVTKANEENKARPDDDERPDAADVKAAAADDGDDDVRSLDAAKRTGARPTGFFTIYKKGQGYWTRMGTLIGVTVIGALLGYTLYTSIPTHFFQHDPALGHRVAMIVTAVFAAVYVFFAVRLMNKPSNVDFLIATDTEMKKVNWTSRKELIGSSKVVILFMVLIAVFLFVNDTIWGFLMYALGVLKLKPPPFT